MKKLWVIVILAAISLWLAKRPDIKTRDAAFQAKVGLSSHHEINDPEGSGPLRTKASNRVSNSTHYTHSPDRLQEFMLPAIVIDGLTLDEAFRKLMTSYEEACGKCGETPLPLTFSIPQGVTRRLTLSLPAGNFNSSVQLLATLAGMKSSRKGMEFRFKPMASELKSVNQSLQVSPNFQTVLNELVGEEQDLKDSNTSKSIQECLEKLGLTDPSTRVSLGVSGDLKLETMSATDAAMISELAKSIGDQAPAQVKSVAKILEIPVDSKWAPPVATQMTDGQIAAIMRDLAQQEGVELLTLPSLTARNGQRVAASIVREVIYPTDDSGKAFESRNVGKVLTIQGNLLGFGHEVDMNFTDTTGGIDSVTGRAVFENRTEMGETSYLGDGGSKLVVQTRPDGSRTVMIYNAQMIDATGQPIH